MLSQLKIFSSERFFSKKFQYKHLSLRLGGRKKYQISIMCILMCKKMMDVCFYLYVDRLANYCDFLLLLAIEMKCAHEVSVYVYVSDSLLIHFNSDD